jgi:hypothetical protein
MLVLRILGLCCCGYLWLELFFAYFMGTNQSEGVPVRVVALGVHAGLLTLCCVLSLFWALWPAVASWIVALTYLAVSLRLNPYWGVGTRLIPSLIVPILLALAAYVERKERINAQTRDG